jgi:hypothetical protein
MRPCWLFSNKASGGGDAGTASSVSAPPDSEVVEVLSGDVQLPGIRDATHAEVGLEVALGNISWRRESAPWLKLGRLGIGVASEIRSRGSPADAEEHPTGPD